MADWITRVSTKRRAENGEGVTVYSPTIGLAELSLIDALGRLPNAKQIDSTQLKEVAVTLEAYADIFRHGGILMKQTGEIYSFDQIPLHMDPYMQSGYDTVKLPYYPDQQLPWGDGFVFDESFPLKSNMTSGLGDSIVTRSPDTFIVLRTIAKGIRNRLMANNSGFLNNVSELGLANLVLARVAYEKSQLQPRRA